MSSTAFEQLPLSGFHTKKIESLAVARSGAQLFAGTADGSLMVYECRPDADADADARDRPRGFACAVTEVLRKFSRDRKAVGQMGAIDLAARLRDRSDALPKVPDMAIVSEPTDLHAVIAHKGVLRWRIKTEGVAVHSSRPGAGSNAIYAMADVVAALRNIAGTLESAGTTHPLCGGPTLIVGTIHGGQSVNIVPDSCLIEVDRRIVPGENIDDISRQTEAEIKRLAEVDFQMLPPDTVCDPLVDDNNRSLADRLAACAKSVCGTSDAIGVAYTTHAPKFAAAGIPTVVFGPGSIDQAHTEDEWIEIAQLDQSAEILYRFIMGL